MASYHGNTRSGAPEIEQIITVIFAGCLHIILESRCPYVSFPKHSSEQILSFPFPSPSSSPSPPSSCSSSSIGLRDKWFKLAHRDCPAALENIGFSHQSNLEPMIVDVILVKRSGNWDLVNYSPKRGYARNLSGKEWYRCSSENDEFGCEIESEKIIERWVVQYESKQSGDNGGGVMGSNRATCKSSHELYKKSILLLRSLYATVRLLPAYKVFRDLISSAQIRAYNLGHRVSSFVEPFTSREEADMQSFVFPPLDTSCGRLCLSVVYFSSELDIISEPSTPISPQVIHEYVGSPMVEPLKRFTAVPVSQCSPSSSPFGRRHSWSYDLYRVSPSSVNPSPSPTYSESCASMPKQLSHRFPPASLRHHIPNETPPAHMKDPNFHEYWPSPTFSPSSSPSPSPPAYNPDSHILKALFGSESAPFGLSVSRLSPLASMPKNQLLPPSPSMGTCGHRVAKTDGYAGLYPTGSMVDKLFASAKEEAGKLSGVKQSSNSSSMKSFSRSPSRFSFQDNFDDSEFSGLLIPDDDDLPESSTRPDAAALFHLLEKAPPLRPDISITTNLVQDSKPVIEEISPESLLGESASLNFSSSEIESSKTTADAFTELVEYKKMKELLLKQCKGTQA
ncbi:autophagy-related 13b-like [Olea europaea subsp. europaea]|uniref:Autophagy-related 13b-like n=2 Tax=Olea europaea subsp. europaea TaxID=158383 RepID=A0A8S0R2M8_OLEEU|nr:autophagy-related 13b-like [Olea europaea subsp. europaea]